MMTTSLHTAERLTVIPQHVKKSHQRSQSDASALPQGLKKSTATTTKLSLGDLSSGRAFDNGCACFESCQSVVNDLRGEKTECSCSVSIRSENIALLNFLGN